MERHSREAVTRWGRLILQPPPGRPSPTRRRSRARICTRATTTRIRRASSVPSPAAKQYEIRDRRAPGLRPRCPEYETIFAFAPCWGMPTRARWRAPMTFAISRHGHDLDGRDAVVRGGRRSSAAGSIRESRWALRLGRLARMLRLVEMTAAREGFGDRLAEGAWRLASRSSRRDERRSTPSSVSSCRALGRRAQGHVDRLCQATRGGSHHDTRPTPQYAQGYDRRGTTASPSSPCGASTSRRVDDSLVLCPLSRRSVASGPSWKSPMAHGPRRHGVGHGAWRSSSAWASGDNLERLFNVREGTRRKDDVLPWRVMHEPIPDGPLGRHALPTRRARHDARSLL